MKWTSREDGPVQVMLEYIVLSVFVHVPSLLLQTGGKYIVLWHCTFADLCRQHSASGRFWCTEGVPNKHSRALLVLDIILQHIPTPQGDDTTVLNAKIIMEAVMRPVSSDVLTTQLRRALQTSAEMLDTKHMVHCRDWDALLDTLRQCVPHRKKRKVRDSTEP